jgi:hypothetical protein
MRYGIISCIVFLLALAGCVEDEPVVTSTEALVRSRFIPIDSINRLTIDLERNSMERSAINDDLDRIDSLEDAGDPTDYTEVKLALNETLDSLNDSRTSLNSTISQLSQGTIRLDFLAAAGSEEVLIFDKAREFYGLPLNSRATQSTFEIGYGSYGGRVTFQYLIDTLFNENRISFSGLNLNIVDLEFDSVKYTCDTVCTTNEATFTFYF